MTAPKDKMAGVQYARLALLPDGFRDTLAPAAEHEASVVRALVDVFQTYGYARVSPPLVEYEDSLIAGPGAAKTKAMFRLMDPDTQRVMAIRTDMTVQASRLAATRLADAPRPLRLAYAGSCLRVKGSQIRPARQFFQAGFELIGSASLEAEIEALVLAVESLHAVGINELTVDLTLAPIIGVLAEQFKLEGDARDAAVSALDAKDIGALDQFAGAVHETFAGLISAAGTAAHALPRLEALSLKGHAGKLTARLARLVDAIQTRLPDVGVTVDPCETHGFEYKTGIGFALFSRSARGELGRGGRYLVSAPDGTTEEAVGFSVYLDVLMAALPAPARADLVYVPYEAGHAAAAKLRAEGWRAIQGLTEEADPLKEARRLGCTHVLAGDKVVSV
ncbi:ATP phosphoribosyltransferase regulatory subunit [Gimibacter soli]|uniref:ATP phosphoribosyltransferase regulatory subunit n=1 Tax=Gimibacter soli TaxID=3024400 RepID=A0AAE9XMN0_9PROT|nr:ATP phosphoribosyltransferase regulatory subunit [Gimibacter soli]WCL53772.1 ATP phosphoribosyltransferase regulatory subunit [Gimibacter soli]